MSAHHAHSVSVMLSRCVVSMDKIIQRMVSNGAMHTTFEWHVLKLKNSFNGDILRTNKNLTKE